MALLIDKVTMRRNYDNYYKRFQQLSKKPVVKVSGLISLTIFTVAFFGMFAILPTFKTIVKLNRDIEDSEVINGKLAKKILSLEKAEEVFAENTNNIKKINQILPEEVMFERLAWQIAFIANKNQISITSEGFGKFDLLESSLITTTSTTDEKGELELIVELAVAGDYLQIKEFLEDLTNIDRLIAIGDVTITSKQSRNQTGLIVANIKLKAHYLENIKDIKNFIHN